jgi:NTE family protein
MNAAVYAYGNMKGGREGARELLEKFWRKTSDQSSWFNPLQRASFGTVPVDPFAWRWFENLTQVLSPYDFNPLNLAPMRAVLESIVDFSLLHRCQSTHLALTATNVRSGKPRVFTTREITVDAVLAAACLPTLAQAVEIDGEHYWDGIYSGFPALGPLIAKAASRDILIAQIAPVARRDLPRRTADIQNRIGEIALGASLLREARALAQMTQLIDDDWIRPEHKNKLMRIHVHAVRSDETVSDLTMVSKYETGWRFLTRLRDAGRLAAELWLETHFDKIGLRSTIDPNDL